jgi:hypothetical protein
MPMAIKTHTLKLNTGVVRDNAALMLGDDMFSSAGQLDEMVCGIQNPVTGCEEFTNLSL